jgi:hypothetical protein
MTVTEKKERKKERREKRKKRKKKNTTQKHMCPPLLEKVPDTDLSSRGWGLGHLNIAHVGRSFERSSHALE